MRRFFLITILFIIPQFSFATDLCEMVSIPFDSEMISSIKKVRGILQYNENEIIYEELFRYTYMGKEFGLRITFEMVNPTTLSNKAFTDQIDVKQKRQWSNPKNALVKELERTDHFQQTMSLFNEDKKVNVAFLEWSSGQTSDALVFYIPVGEGSVDKIYIQFFNIWGEHKGWKNKLSVSDILSLEHNDKVYMLYNSIKNCMQKLSLNIPKWGLLNDSNVRIREKPSLEANIITTLDKDKLLKIIEVSDEKMKISDMNSYWYKVILESGQIGWIYGYFVDTLGN